MGKARHGESMRMRPEEFFYSSQQRRSGDEGRKRTIPLQVWHKASFICY